MNGYILLALAIVSEIVSTSMLKASLGFTKWLPSVCFVIGMGGSFYFLSQALVQVPLSVAYAIWSGVGTALTALVAIVLWKEHFDIYTFAGIGLIIAGVVILNLKSATH